MSDRDKKPPQKGGWGKISRPLVFWGLIFLTSLLLFSMMDARTGATEELTYTEFSRELERGNILEVTLADGAMVEGVLKAPIRGERGEIDRFETHLPVRDSEVLLERLEQQGVIISARDAGRDWTAILLGILPWILIIGIWIFILKQMQSGGSKAFQFGKSKAKLLSPDRPKVTFEDVAGAAEAKYELQEIVEFLRDPKQFSRLGGRIPKGALLVGPPGTGKTLLARAVAGEAGRPFFSMSGSDFVEMFVGVGASRVRDLFEQGKAQAPCIIFIDEIDAVGRHRGAGVGGGHDEREQTLNQLLVEMDGFEANDGVILIAATNRPDVLDPALLRPGRFDRQIMVDTPDLKGREGILQVHMAKVPVAEDVDVTAIARGTPGMSGADLANLVNEAALLAARRGHEQVLNRDFEEAKDKVMLGAERRSMVLSEAERRLTAYHEAGHAVVALRFPGLDPLHKVTIIPRGRALGITASLPEEDRHSYSRDYLFARLVMLYGGRVAEEMIFGADKVTTGAGNDIERATSMARRMVTQFGMSDRVGPMAIEESEQEVFLGRDISQSRKISEQTAQLVDSEVKRMLDEAYERAREILTEHSDLMEEMALALLDRESIDRDEIAALSRGERLAPLPEVPAPQATELAPQAAAAEEEEARDREGDEVETRLSGAVARDRSGSDAAPPHGGERAEPDASR